MIQLQLLWSWISLIWIMWWHYLGGDVIIFSNSNLWVSKTQFSWPYKSNPATDFMPSRRLNIHILLKCLSFWPVVLGVEFETWKIFSSLRRVVKQKYKRHHQYHDSNSEGRSHDSRRKEQTKILESHVEADLRKRTTVTGNILSTRRLEIPMVTTNGEDSAMTPSTFTLKFASHLAPESKV